MTLPDHTYWRSALEGKFLPISADAPQPGYYKRRRQTGGWLAVAIWADMDDGGAIRIVDGGKLVRPEQHMDVWLWCAENPITYELYTTVWNGGEWPDEVPGLGHNAPPPADDIDLLSEQVESAIGLLVNYKELKSDAECDQAANLRDRLNDLSKTADKLRSDEKRPHDEAARLVQAKWLPVVNAAKEAASSLRIPIGAWLRAKEAEALKTAAKAADAGVAAPTPVVRAGGAHGKKTSLRTVTVAEVTDYYAALEHLKDNEEIRATVDRLANRMAKAGVAIPGVKIIKRKEAA